MEFIVLDKIINSELGEFLYMAKSASIIIDCVFGSNKTHLIFGGFNDSLKEGTKNILVLII